MNTRQQKILSAVIEEYTQTAIPVGSKILVDKYGFNVSSATMRNDLNALEKDGFFYQPHVSAGRIPTDKGYKFFVEEIMPDKELSLKDQKKLQTEVLKLRAQKTRLSKTTAKLLSVFSGNLALSGGKEDVAEFGIHELLENPEFQNADEFCKIAEVMDYIDENLDAIFKSVEKGETKIFIGKDNPIKNISNCSMIVSPYENKQGEKSFLALIGPKRMEYAKNKSLINYVKKLLSSSAVIIIIAGSLQIVMN